MEVVNQNGTVSSMSGPTRGKSFQQVVYPGLKRARDISQASLPNLEAAKQSVFLPKRVLIESISSQTTCCRSVSSSSKRSFVTASFEITSPTYTQN